MYQFKIKFDQSKVCATKDEKHKFHPINLIE